MTLLQRETRLNEELAQQPAAILNAQFLYLTNPQRREHCGNVVLSNAISKGKMGTLIRRMDKELFTQLTQLYI